MYIYVCVCRYYFFTLEAIAALGLLAHDVEDGVDELGAFGVMALGPVIAGARVSGHGILGSKEASEGGGPEGVQMGGLEV